MKKLEARCALCGNCPLGATRTKLVFGVGKAPSELMLIGEGPGEQEDLQGEPFVGPAGRLLDDMLEMIGLDRTRIYIANTVKCRPPMNRDPAQEEMDACRPWLEEQIKLVRPKIIVCSTTPRPCCATYPSGPRPLRTCASCAASCAGTPHSTKNKETP